MKIMNTNPTYQQEYGINDQKKFFFQKRLSYVQIVVWVGGICFLSIVLSLIPDVLMTLLPGNKLVYSRPIIVNIKSLQQGSVTRP